MSRRPRDIEQLALSPQENAGHLVDLIRTDILRGEYLPNERLVEEDLTVRYDESRASVRAALIALAGERLVEREVNRGARVRSISREEAIELCEIRMLLEGLCAAKAAERVTPADSRTLRKLISQMKPHVDAGDATAYSLLNKTFHEYIRELSGREATCKIIRQLRNQSVRLQFRLLLTPGRVAQSHLEHEEIVEAITNRDSSRAEKAMHAHLVSVINLLLAAKEVEIR